jgi:uncharacterized membrane protein
MLAETSRGSIVQQIIHPYESHFVVALLLLALMGMGLLAVQNMRTLYAKPTDEMEQKPAPGLSDGR